MPASSHGLPTSGMRAAWPPHFPHRMRMASTQGRCGELPSNCSQPATARAFFRLARQGGSPAFLADLREGRGTETPFFGRPAFSNPFPALIARATGLPLYAVRVIRLPNAHFSMRIERIEVPKTDNRDADVAAATAALQARFEEFIREAPEQWMWEPCETDAVESRRSRR